MQTGAFVKALNESRMPVFTFNEALKMLQMPRAYTRLFLHRAVKNNLLGRAERGLYYVKERSNEYEVASHMLYPSYISMVSALRYYGLTTQIPNTVYVLSPERHRNLKNVMGFSITFRQIRPEMMFGYHKEADGNIFIADPEKAIVDILYFKDVNDLDMDVLEEPPRIDVDKLIGYAEKSRDRKVITGVLDLLSGYRYRKQAKKLVACAREGDFMIDNDTLLNTQYYEHPYQKEKDYLQELLLSFVYRDAAGLVFKGGTALSKFYGLPRFSDDLDFSLLRGGKTETARCLDNAVKKASESYSTRVLRRRDKHDILAYELSIMGPLFKTAEKYQHLKLGVDLTSGVIETPAALRRNPRYPDVMPYVALVMKEDEILAEKTHALLFRHTAKARDLFDLYFLLEKGIAIRASLIDKKMREHGQAYSSERLEGRINLLGSVWTRELSRLLPEKEFVGYNEAKNRVLEGFKSADML